MNPLHFLVVFVGAGLGGMLRHAVNAVAPRLVGLSFPYGTLAINISGSLVMGLLAGYFATKHDPGQVWRLFLTTGVMGGYTTFSAFSLETVLLYERGEFLLSAIYVAGSVVLSVAALLAGLIIVRHLGG
ncbi:MAG TPA: fluoride efflux transporter CrcB [Burkholderiaceae bacterium]|nr:fluoride efflux transporter CrcB [Burkholderiaceae bacterium]